ncbi:MAG: MarR family transcriptional regulator [Bacteroidetes bacterium]|nr:MarR family transcriptional regulator [Bacteroidota bacterium]
MKKAIDPNLQMMVDIMKTGNCIDNVVTKTLKPYNITHIQYNILRILRGVHPEPLYVGEIKNRILFANSDITRLLDRMIDKGIIERNICSENRRRIEVRITEAGLQLLLDATPGIDAALGHYLKDIISESEANATVALLLKIRESIE